MASALLYAQDFYLLPLRTVCNDSLAIPLIDLMIGTDCAYVSLIDESIDHERNRFELQIGKVDVKKSNLSR